ncbi:MAG: UDP-N-acetyl-D-mannosamine dehydrogenase [Fidelibacterota bacterium]|nr:MAG: UDP-N-acetyl-D-mannosamine dehydrogenase [Candidatus Neomarinimicrobiota bacterium]
MNSPINRVSVIGLGYIGLPTAAVIASRGIQVIGIDINSNTVEIINRGKVHFVEPELDIVVRGAVDSGMLRAVTQPEPADVFIVAVPTPTRADHSPDLSIIQSAVYTIAPMLQPGNLVVLESTSTVGTTEIMARWLSEKRSDLTFPHQVGEQADILIAHSPERVLPGKVLRELVENDRTIGGMSLASTERAVDLYRIIIEGECHTTDVRTAEMTKLVENAFRDLNIAFANELSLICDQLGINVWELIRLANHHPRVNILKPGPGVGGHCIAIDPWFIIDLAPELACLIRTARDVNDSKPRYVVEKIKQAAAEFHQPMITCLGLAFKADIDDLRESPAVKIVQELARYAGRILVVEPYIEKLPHELSNQTGIELIELEKGLEKADIVALLVDHKAFRRIEWDKLGGKTIIDTRGIIK